MTETTTVSTPQGDARVVRSAPAAGAAWATLVLSHGAGGGLGAPDLVVAAEALPRHGIEVVLVEQPWRVAGRRVAPRPERLDEAFAAVVTAIAPDPPFVVGGRSAGARVACRTGAGLGASGVLALAFPLHPPGRPERSRIAELAGAALPTLVVQGARDAFGSPGDVRAALDAHGPGPHVRVVEVPDADHGFAVRFGDGGVTVRDKGLRASLVHVRSFLRAAAGCASRGNT